MGGLCLVLTSDHNVSHSTIENALHEQGVFDGYQIQIRPDRDQLMILIQVNVPITWITGAGIPELPAEQVLRTFAAAIEEIDRTTDG